MNIKKIINLSEYTANQLSKFRTKYCTEINDDGRGTHNTNSQFKFKTTMLKSTLCDYSDVYIGADVALIAADRYNKVVIIKNSGPFTDCIREIINTEVDNTKYLDVVTSVYNL